MVLNHDLARSEAQKLLLSRCHDPKPRQRSHHFVVQTNYVLALDLGAKDLGYGHVGKIAGEAKLLRGLEVVSRDRSMIVLGKRPEGGLGEWGSSFSTVWVLLLPTA